MRRFFSLSAVYLLLATLLLGCWSNLPSLINTASAQQGALPKQAERLSAQAQRQIQDLLNEKEARTETQKKINSQLLYASKQQQGLSIANSVSKLSLDVDVSEKNLTTVNIRGDITENLTQTVENVGGEIIYASKQAKSLKAKVPLESLETIASLSEVSFIYPASREAMLQRSEQPPESARQIAPFGKSLLNQVQSQNNFSERAAQLRAQLTKSLAAASQKTDLQGPIAANVGAAGTQGDIAHRARDARNFFGINGTGIKVGVLSDSVRYLQQSQATGDLPPDVTVIPGQSGIQPDNSDAGEGTAMLEIVHDIAPGAQLFFATAFTSEASFADNIRRLRNEYNCDIIIDDVIYFDESPFQDTTVAQAVNDVTASGALYFSSAGNEGNFNDGTSGTWEGDFKSGGTLATLPSGYTVLDYGSGVISNRIEATSNDPTLLIWADPYGASTNDYDLFILNSTLTTVLGASTDVQNGNSDPFEGLGGSPAGARVVVAKKNGAADRPLNLIVFRGQLGISTPGATRGHSATRDAFSVAAVNVAVANGGPFIGGPTNPVELFSSDGPRRIFYNADGTPITPGNLLIRTRGGELRQKPDLTAADGVATTLPPSTGLNPFFGTSAAAPHAGAIAALLKSARPTLTPARIRRALTATALDIEAPGRDRDSGYGIVDAYTALQFIGAQARPTLELGSVSATPIGGDNDAFIEPGEAAQLNVQLRNLGGAEATGVSAQLTTTTPGVTIFTPTSTYPNIPANGGTAVNNQPFVFALSRNAPCGLKINFTLRVAYTGQATAQSFNFTVQTGQPATSASTVSYTGPAVPIPDSNPTGVNVPLTVSGVGTINNLKFSIDGSNCTAAAGATTVGIDHTWTADLVIRLRSPQGTTVTLINQAGGSGNNFCQTVLDDNATTSIQSITATGTPPLGPPHTGTFKPASPLAAFNGENADGVWTLSVTDVAGGDVGNVRAFSLIVTPFACAFNSSQALANGSYTITDKQSGKVLDVYGISQDNGASIVQWPANGGANQMWDVAAVRDGYYRLLAKHSGKALDVSGVSLNSGAIVHQWDYFGGDNQLWKIESVGDGYYRLTAKHSGKALDIFGGALDNGSPTVQTDYTGSDTQKWKFDLVQ